MKKKLLSTFYKELSIPNEVQIFNNNKKGFIIKGSLGWTNLPVNISNFELHNNTLPGDALSGYKGLPQTSQNAITSKESHPNMDHFCRYNMKTNKLCFLFPYLTFYNPKLDSLIENSYFKAHFGNLQTKIKNQITGVQEAFVITLKLNGLGYKAFLSLLQQDQKKKRRNLPRNFNFVEKNEIKNIDSFKLKGESSANQSLILDLGFSHLISYKIPLEILLFIPKPDIISIYGLDKALVSQFASEIKGIKRPESFTGKGIFYADEILKIKSGKKS